MSNETDHPATGRRGYQERLQSHLLRLHHLAPADGDHLRTDPPAAPRSPSHRGQRRAADRVSRRRRLRRYLGIMLGRPRALRQVRRQPVAQGRRQGDPRRGLQPCRDDVPFCRRGRRALPTPSPRPRWAPTSTTRITICSGRRASATASGSPKQKYVFAEDPFYGAGAQVLVPAAKVDIAVLCVQQVGEEGTVRVNGQYYSDPEAARAADITIVMAEEIVPEEYLRRNADQNTIASFEVDHILECPYRRPSHRHVRPLRCRRRLPQGFLWQDPQPGRLR